MKMHTNTPRVAHVDHVGVRDRGDVSSTRVEHEERSVFALPARVAYVYACVMAAALIGYGLWWREAPLMFNDSGSYMSLARDLTDLHLDTMHDRTAGYPLLLLLTRSADEPGRALFYISLLMHCATVWMLASVLYRAGASRAALLAFGFVMMLPLYVEPAATVMTETLTQFLVAAGFASVLRYLEKSHPLSLAIASSAFGYAALTRPTYQLLAVAVVVVVAAVMLWSRGIRGTRRVIVTSISLLAGTAILVGSYSLLSYRSIGYFGQTPFLGYNLSTRTVKFVERLPDEYAAVREVLIKHRDNVMAQRGSSHGGFNYFNEARREDLPAVTGLNGVDLANYMFRINLVLIKMAPLLYLEEVLRTIPSFWFPNYGAIAYPRMLQVLWVVIHFGVFACFVLQLVVVSGMAMYLASIKLARPTAGIVIADIPVTGLQATAYILAIVLITYTMVLSCALGVGDPRYRSPVDGLILLTTVLGFQVWWRAAAADGGPLYFLRQRASTPLPPFHT